MPYNFNLVTLKCAINYKCKFIYSEIFLDAVYNQAIRYDNTCNVTAMN